jgi:hypothetical protein
VPLISSIGISDGVPLQLPGELPLAERTSTPATAATGGTSPDNVLPFERPKKKKDSIPPEEVTFIKNPSSPSLGQIDETAAGQLAAVKSKAIVPRKNSALARRRRYKYHFQLLIGFAGLMSALALLTWMSQLNKTAKQVAQSTTTNNNKVDTTKIVQPAAPVGAAVATIPQPTVSPVATTTASDLTKETAQSLVEKWLVAKNSALSKSYDLTSLSEVLTEPALTRARMRAQEAKESGAHLEYKHQVKVQSVTPPVQGIQRVEALVNESALYYDQGKLVNGLSYEKNLRLKYEVVNQGGRWLIRDMTVIQ